MDFDNERSYTNFKRYPVPPAPPPSWPPSKLSWLVLMKKFAIYGEAVTGWPAEISAELLFIWKTFARLQR